MTIFLMKKYCMHRQYISMFLKIIARLHDFSVALWLALQTINKEKDK